MTRVTVHEYAASLAPRYRAARRREKGRILDEFCKTTGQHRKAAIRLLGGVRRLKTRRKPRERRYGREVAEALKRLWEVGDQMCGKLLKGAIPELLEALERRASAAACERRFAGTEERGSCADLERVGWG